LGVRFRAPRFGFRANNPKLEGVGGSNPAWPVPLVTGRWAYLGFTNGGGVLSAKEGEY